ncbi:MAG: hypothetical protein GY862_32385 [Gammaproteobacteria bacterium]|nr:hypothetical protein [Gammaproteobacteria bacterium]
MSLDPVLFPCEISRGAFSSERIFKLNLQGGESYNSLADYHYCMDSNRKALSKDYPAEDKSINGYIQAYLLPKQEGSTYISIPDGEVIPVSEDEIVKGKNIVVYE